MGELHNRASDTQTQILSRKDEIIQQNQTEDPNDKQQAEYSKAVGELPVVKAELEEKQPLAEEALKTIEDLKVRRKELRAEKKSLESGSSAEEPDENAGGEEESSDDR